MKAEECPRLDKCLSVKSLFSREWASDADLTAASASYAPRVRGRLTKTGVLRTGIS